jgi:hypothetical protein
MKSKASRKHTHSSHGNKAITQEEIEQHAPYFKMILTESNLVFKK